MLCFRKFPVAKKFMDKGGGGNMIFRRKLFVSQCRQVWGIENIYASEGYVTIFRRNCFVSQYRKIP